MPRHVLDALPQGSEELDSPVVGVEAGLSELCGQRFGVATTDVVAPGAELSGELVDLIVGITQGLGNLANRGAIAIGDDVGGHCGAVRAVAPIDVLDDLLALVARG